VAGYLQSHENVVDDERGIMGRNGNKRVGRRLACLLRQAGLRPLPI